MDNTVLDTSNGMQDPSNNAPVNDFSNSSDSGSAAPIDQSNKAAPAQASERIFKQSEVGSLVNRARHEAYEKAKREFDASQRTQAATSQNNENSADQQSTIPLHQVDSIVEKKIQMARDEAIANQVANEFNSKMNAAKAKYQDFDEVISDLNLNTMLPVVSWANSFDNTADIMYDLAKNPTKLSNVMNLANAGQSQLAYKELMKLSQSIKVNENALKVPQPNAPLNQLKSSAIGSDNGESDVQAYQKQDYCRG